MSRSDDGPAEAIAAYEQPVNGASVQQTCATIRLSDAISPATGAIAQARTRTI
jgi:hypothetical protein